MNEWKSVAEVLDFAIEREREAVVFYKELAAKTTTASTRVAYEDFAKEEGGHQAKLVRMKESGQLQQANQKVLDLKIGDYLVEPNPDVELDYPQALILAMKREKAAFKLYSDLAAATDDADLRAALLVLAQEEARHKLRFEVEYDEHVLDED